MVRTAEKCYRSVCHGWLIMVWLTWELGTHGSDRRNTRPTGRNEAESLVWVMLVTLIRRSFILTRATEDTMSETSRMTICVGD